MNIPDSLLKFLKKNYSVIITITLFIFLEVPFLDNSRPILIDEAFYSNPSYNFIVFHNFGNTNIGFGGNASIIYSIYLSIYFFLFGVSLFTARLSAVIAGILSILVFRKLFKIAKVSEFNSLISLSFFVFANNYLTILKYARPEALTLTLSLCMLLTLYYYIKNNYGIKYLLTLMFLIFAIINCHPFGALIVILSVIIIICDIFWEKEFKRLFHPVILMIMFVFASSFVILFFAISNNMAIKDSFIFVMQRSSAESFWSELTAKINLTINYYIISKRIVTFLPQIIIIITGLFFIKKNKNVFFVSLCGIITLFLAYSLLSSSMFVNIFIYAFIFSVLSLSLILETVKEEKFLYKTVGIFAAMVIFVNLAAFGLFTYSKYDPNINVKMKKISSLIPQNSNVITSAAFWFIEPEKVFKEWGYYKNKKELRNNNFFVITVDYYKNEDKETVNSIISEGNHSPDTLMTTYSKIYGQINLIKFSIKK
jgi:hypothetical protein